MEFLSQVLSSEHGPEVKLSASELQGGGRERGGKGEREWREGRVKVEGYTVSKPGPDPRCHYFATTN